MSAVRAYPLYEPTASLAANDHTHAPERPSRSALHCNRFTGSIADIPRGNIREKVLGTRSVTMSYDVRNRLSAANDTGETGNRAVSYDTRGNVTWLGGQNFTYNAMNRPTSMGGDVDAVHRYDGHGRRIRTVTYPDEGGYIIRYNVFGATGDLIFNVQIDQSPTDENYVTTMVKMDGQTIARVKSEGRPWNYTDTVTYLHNDHLGSAGSGTDESGAVAWREEYSPFGMTLINNAANDNQAGFTGHIKDSDTGLNYMQARYYDPVIGRFLSVDPVGFLDTGNPAMFNRHAYCYDDPVNCTDPDGEFGVFGAVSGVVLGAVIRGATGGDIFDAKSIAADAALGAVGAGLANKAVQLARLSKTGLSAGQKLGATSNIAKAADEGVYVLREGGETYVGQSGNLAKRSAQSAAERGLQNAPGVRLGVEGGKASREVAEQGVLNAAGGVKNTLNAVNPIGAARQGLLQNPQLGNISSVYAQGVSNAGAAAAGATAGVANNLEELR